MAHCSRRARASRIRVPPLLALVECPLGIGHGAFEIAAIEFQQPAIDVHGADSAVMPVPGVDFEGLGEVGPRVRAETLHGGARGAGSILFGPLSRRTTVNSVFSPAGAAAAAAAAGAAAAATGAAAETPTWTRGP